MTIKEYMKNEAKHVDWLIKRAEENSRPGFSRIAHECARDYLHSARQALFSLTLLTRCTDVNLSDFEAELLDKEHMINNLSKNLEAIS